MLGPRDLRFDCSGESLASGHSEGYRVIPSFASRKPYEREVVGTVEEPWCSTDHVEVETPAISKALCRIFGRA